MLYGRTNRNRPHLTHIVDILSDTGGSVHIVRHRLVTTGAWPDDPEFEDYWTPRLLARWWMPSSMWWGVSLL